MKIIEIQIPDMQSGHCQMRVKNAIQLNPGTEVVSHRSGVATVQLADETFYNVVIDAIKKAGYNPIENISEGTKTLITDDHIQLKTNINCGGCVSKISQSLDHADGVCHWDVDTLNPDKVLTVHSIGITEKELIELVKKNGFKAEAILPESVHSK